MKKIIALGIFGVMGLAFLLGGCAESISPHVYSSQDVGQANRVVPATVVSMRPIAIDRTTGVGGLVGAAAGAVAGSAIGGGTRANVLGGIGGALVGGLAGHAIEKGVSKKHGMEYVLRTRKGALLTVTQTQDLQLYVGQKVLIVYGRQTKIVPNTAGV